MTGLRFQTWLVIGLALAYPSITPAESPLMVFASVPPLAGVAERIGRPYVSADTLVQPNQDPHTFEPTPRQISALSSARLYFLAQMPFETTLTKKLQSMLPNLTIVDTGKGAKCRPLETTCLDHDPELQHAADTPQLDPHLWLGPSQLAAQAQNITAALAQADPAHTAEFNRNRDEFLAALDATQTRIRSVLKPYESRSFLVFHPAFGYFADAFGLRQIPVEIEGKSPAPRQLQQMIALARKENVRVVFVQPQNDPKAGEALANAMGGRVVVMDSQMRDVLANLDHIASRLEEAFQP